MFLVLSFTYWILRISLSVNCLIDTARCARICPFPFKYISKCNVKWHLTATDELDVCFEFTFRTSLWKRTRRMFVHCFGLVFFFSCTWVQCDCSSIFLFHFTLNICTLGDQYEQVFCSIVTIYPSLKFCILLGLPLLYTNCTFVSWMPKTKAAF